MNANLVRDVDHLPEVLMRYEHDVVEVLSTSVRTVNEMLFVGRTRIDVCTSNVVTT